MFPIDWSLQKGDFGMSGWEGSTAKKGSRFKKLALMSSQRCIVHAALVKSIPTYLPTYLFKQNPVQFIIAGFQENLKHFTFCNICPQQTDLELN